MGGHYVVKRGDLKRVWDALMKAGVRSFNIHVLHPRLRWMLRAACLLPSAQLRSIPYGLVMKINRAIMKGNLIVEVDLNE